MSDATNPVSPGQPGLPRHYQTASHGHDGGLGVGLPAILAIGGGLAALYLIEKQTKALSRGASYVGEQAHDWYDEAGDWLGETAHDVRETAGEWTESAQGGLLAAGAKAAGVVGLLKALGGGELSAGATRAAKALAMKKLAAYAAGAGARASKVAAKHPKYASAASAAAVKARAAAKDQAERAKRAYRSYRGLPEPKESHFGAGGAALSLTVLGLAAGAAYLFAQNHPDQLAKARKQAGKYGDSAADIARTAYESALHAGEYVGEHAGEYAHEVARRVGLEGAVPANDEQLVSSVRRAVGQAVSGDYSDLQIVSHDGEVTLSGKMPAEGSDAVVAAVKKLPGVKDVKVEANA